MTASIACARAARSRAARSRAAHPALLLALTLCTACLPAERNPASAAGPSAPVADATASGGGGDGAAAGGEASGGQTTGGQATGGQGSGGQATGGHGTGGTGGQGTGGTGGQGSGGTGGQGSGGAGGQGSGGIGGQGTGGTGGAGVLDNDGDGLLDAQDNCPGVPNASQRDADFDGTGDACDGEDTDLDGVPDSEDLCPALDVRPLDGDGDGVGDQCDLCPNVADSAQRDGDGDGLGDACDTPDDDDGDDLSAADDNCPAVANRDQADRDADGVGDACDGCPNAPDFSQRDVDGDGFGDACDACPDAPAVGDSHRDLDGDGVAACAGDCDDLAFSVHPGASERCDGLDNDCNLETDELWAGLGNACSAGSGACERQGVFFCADEMTAACSAVPGRPAPEACNRVDDDCDGLVDESLVGCCEPGDLSPCGAEVGVCEAGTQLCLENRTWGACSGRGPGVELCNGLDDDCNGTSDDGFAPVDCGVGRCARAVAACVNGRPGPCDPLAGALAEACNGVDDDCDGTVDDGFNLLTDANNCGRCGQVCEAGSPCENGACNGRNVILRCGNSARDVGMFVRGPAAGLRVVAGCLPDARTAAMLVTRFGKDQLAANAPALRAWVNAGGALIGEFDTSLTLMSVVLQLQTPARGPLSGECHDEIMPLYKMHPEDPVWRESGLQQPAFLDTGCGYEIPFGSIPGFVPMGSNAPDHVMLGYVEYGLGRVWMVESDWQDADNAALSPQSRDLMAWMIAGWRPSNFTRCQNGFDDDGDGTFDLWDSGCTSPADAVEGPRQAAQCSDALDNDRNGATDYPWDPGCLAVGDPTEQAPAVAAPCFNGIDDDRDGQTDFPADSGCHGAGDVDEDFNKRSLACADGVDNDQDGGTDYPEDEQCATPDQSNERFSVAPGAELVGVQRNLRLADVPDWRICFTSFYDDQVTPLARLQANCVGAEIMLACRVAGANVLDVAASAPRADVFFDVGDGAQASHVANGVQFYYDTTQSMGFAPEGVEINRDSCDYLALPVWNQNPDDGTGASRLCWHTADGHLATGFRCGLATDFGQVYERVILTR